MFLLFFARVLMHAWTRVYVLTVDRSTTGDTWRVYSVVREARRLKQLAVQSPNWYGYGCVAPNTYGYDQLANWNSATQTSTNELVGGWRILSHVCGLFSHTHLTAFTYILFWCWRIRLFFCCRCFTAILSIAVSAHRHKQMRRWSPCCRIILS